MSESPTTRRQDRTLLVISYFVLFTVAYFGLREIQREGKPWQVAAALLLLFGILQTRIPQAGASAWRIHLYLAVQTSLVAGATLLGSAGTNVAVLFFILSPQAMLMLPQRLGMLWIGIFILVTAGLFVMVFGNAEGLAPLPAFAAGYIFFGVFAQALIRADAARQQSQTLLVELQQAHSQLQEYATRVEELAVVEERSRLAREMHDTLGHRLTVAAVQLEGAQRLLSTDVERASQLIDTVREQVREGLNELRHTVAALRAPIEADLQLRRSLQRLAAHFREATGITVHLLLPDERLDLPAAHRMALYRAAQEALTNVQRHAQATDVWLQLALSDGMVALTVSDNGLGISGGAEQVGFGLRGMRERAAQLGGELFVDPRPGGGTQLQLRLPLPTEEANG